MARSNHATSYCHERPKNCTPLRWLHVRTNGYKKDTALPGKMNTTTPGVLSAFWKCHWVIIRVFRFLDYLVSVAHICRFNLVSLLLGHRQRFTSKEQYIRLKRFFFNRDHFFLEVSKELWSFAIWVDLPFYFHTALNYLYVHLDVWASVSLFKGVNIAPRNKQ